MTHSDILESMPHQPYWWRQVPFIRRQLDAWNEPVLSRAAVQMLFNVSHMQAQRIMHQVGCWKVGKQLVVARPRLLDWLRAVERSEEYASEEFRRGRMEDKLKESRSIPVRYNPKVKDVEMLPAGIQLAPGRLTIEFFGFEDLAKHLVELSQIMSQDLIRFRTLCEG